MLRHQGTIRIETERLILRPFTLSDAEDMYNNWASDPNVTRYLTWEVHEDPFATENLLAAWCALYEDPAIYNWAIELRSLGQAVGNVSVVDRSDRNMCCDLGYCLSARFWRQGIMTEAVRAVIGYLMDEVGYHRVGAWHDIRNPASGRVMQKSGMAYEGTKRGCHLDRDGVFTDLCFYGITREMRKREGDVPT